MAGRSPRAPRSDGRRLAGAASVMQPGDELRRVEGRELVRPRPGGRRWCGGMGARSGPWPAGDVAASGPVAATGRRSPWQRHGRAGGGPAGVIGAVGAEVGAVRTTGSGGGRRCRRAAGVVATTATAVMTRRRDEPAGHDQASAGLRGQPLPVAHRVLEDPVGHRGDGDGRQQRWPPAATRRGVRARPRPARAPASARGRCCTTAARPSHRPQVEQPDGPGPSSGPPSDDRRGGAAPGTSAAGPGNGVPASKRTAAATITTRPAHADGAPHERGHPPGMRRRAAPAGAGEQLPGAGREAEERPGLVAVREQDAGGEGERPADDDQRADGPRRGAGSRPPVAGATATPGRTAPPAPATRSAAAVTARGRRPGSRLAPWASTMLIDERGGGERVAGQIGRATAGRARGPDQQGGHDDQRRRRQQPAGPAGPEAAEPDRPGALQLARAAAT